MEIKLTKNFTLKEMCYSEKAQKNRIPNTPNSEQINNLATLCEKVLQPLRDFLGKPVKINSGFRSKALNTFIGGSKTSQHMKGEAADIRCESREDAMAKYEFIRDNLEYDQLIMEQKQYAWGPGYWVHVSYRSGNNRKQHFFLVKN